MPFKSFVLGLLLSACAHASAGVVENFDRAESGLSPNPSLKTSIVEAAGSSAGGKALMIEWADDHRAYSECVYAKPQVLAELTPDRLVALRAEVWVPAAPSVSSLAVRLLDSQNEVFQWTLRLARTQTDGWQKVTIPIDPEKPNGNWGGRVNGKVDYPVKLLGYAFVYAGGKVSAGNIKIGQISTVAMPKITFETDRFPNIVTPGAAGRCGVSVTNPQDHPVEALLTGKVTDYFGKASDISISATIPANGNAQLALPLTDTEPGIRWLDGMIKIGDSEISYKNSFVIAAPLERISKPDDFLFSICSHSEHYPNDIREKEMMAAAAAGASVMRVGDAWAHIQPKPDQWNWGVQDHLVELAARYGLETQPILGYGPSHAASEALRAAQQEAYKNKDANAWKITLFGPPEDAPWRKFVSEFVARYRGKIRFYEIWNEPDLSFWRGTTEQYIQLLRSASEEIRKADPSARVMTGGFATVLPHAGRAKNPDLQERVLTEAADAFDIHAIHQHGPFSEFKRAAEGELRRIRAGMPVQKPLYFNETALSSSFQGEKSQALALMKKMSYVMASGAIGYTWYDLRNDGANTADPEHNYGLVTQDFSPKASFAAYLEIVRQLQGMRPLGNLDLGDAYEAHVFGSERGRTLVLWQEGQFATTLPILLDAGGSAVRATNIMGAARELPQVGGFVMIQPTPDPVYINFGSGSGMPKMAGLLANLEGPAEAEIGVPLKLTAVVNNPLAQPMKIKLKWIDSAGREMNQTLPVNAQSQARLPIETKAPHPRSVMHGMTLNFSAEGLPWSGAMRFNAPIVRVLGDVPPEKRDPDWILNQNSDVVSFTGADPSLKALYWRGADDLSARVWLWRENDNLRIRADVRDDKHVQKESAANLWRADSIQFAFGLPDSKEYWELGVAQTDEGSVMRAAWTTPAGITGAEDFFTAQCAPLPGGLRYDITLPLAKFNLAGNALVRGLRINLVINDNDDALRKQLIRIAPGLGETKNPAAFPVIRVPQPKP